MWMSAEILDPAGNVMMRDEAEVRRESDRVDLIASINDHFRYTYPDRSLRDDVTKAGCTIRSGASDRKRDGAAGEPVELSQGA
jgi:hypothetical protein